ncbi:MAG: coproporphyrinogen III oxidase, partial [Magnetococcales bacterium]|nr:coproporphyrinogen III oxidase [Magnetococcales bacterium]
MMQHPVSQQVQFDRALINRYDRSGPRYTSYPTAPHFVETFGPDDLRRDIDAATVGNPTRPLSLYLHIPF